MTKPLRTKNNVMPSAETLLICWYQPGGFRIGIALGSRCANMTQNAATKRNPVKDSMVSRRSMCPPCAKLPVV
jgi:hypothetical protein